MLSFYSNFHLWLIPNGTGMAPSTFEPKGKLNRGYICFDVRGASSHFHVFSDHKKGSGNIPLVLLGNDNTTKDQVMKLYALYNAQHTSEKLRKEVSLKYTELKTTNL